MKKMLHLMHQDAAGGGPVVVNQLIRDFSKSFSVTAVVGGRGRVTTFCEEAGIPVYSIAIDRFWKCGWGFLQLLFLLRKIRPEVMFLHGQWAAPLGALAGKLAGIPVMIYVAHSPAFYHRQTLKNAVRSYVSEKIPCHWVDALIVLSRGNRYQYLIRQWADEKKIHLIHNGLDERDLPGDGQAVRSKWNWNPQHRHVLFLGRLDRQKGVRWLLLAWQKLMENRTGAELWVVGSGPMEKELQALAEKLGLKKNCHFVPDQLNGRAWIAAADVIVLPSLYEGHALVPLEAMAAGKAFIGTEVDGISDSLRSEIEGLLVAPGDVKALAAALGRWFDEPGLGAELGRRGLERIKEFDWAESFRSYDDRVRQLLREKVR